MYQDQSCCFALNRRHFLASSIAAAASSGPKVTAAGEASENVSYNIPPIQLWDPRSDTFSPYFPIG